MKALVSHLFKVDAIKFGEFLLKSGSISPIYIDLRVIIGYPDLLNSISEAMYNVMSKNVDQLCGVPYTALPLASCISINHNVPCVIKRKEAKSYGTKKLVEGVYAKGMSCCIIEDVITTGSSVMETAKELQSVGLNVTEVIVLIDRGQGGRENLENAGFKVKSLLTLEDILSTLLKIGKITDNQYDICTAYIATKPKTSKPNELDWKERSEKSENAVVKRLFEIINIKKTKLCVAADVRSMSSLMALARSIAPYICLLKVHADIIDDFDIVEMLKLKELSIDKQFLIMEDRKFADIGNTVKMQIENKRFDYLSWCDLVTVHCLPGDGVLDSLEAAAGARGSQLGCVLVAEMSSCGTLTDDGYKERCLQMALRHKSTVAGFVSQSLVTETHQGFLHFTPGVKLAPAADCLGQNYRAASDLKEAGFVDVFIVGRGVTEAECPASQAELYRDNTL